MIHIATVHYQTDKWIDIQLKYLNKYIKEDFRVYTFLSGEAIKYKNNFFFACIEPINYHAIKLNILADFISIAAKNKNDIIIFLDGDAFPIGNVMKLIREKLKKHKLLAIQRVENEGDIQPHPSFCATTIGFWKEINGDWKSGFKWKINSGIFVTDAGGNLLEKLQKFNTNWYPLKRTNSLSYHPLWFGIYENLIYHHGAGFRKPLSRLDVQRRNFFIKSYYKILNEMPQTLKSFLDLTHILFYKNIKTSNTIFKLINSDPFIFKRNKNIINNDFSNQ